MADKAMRKTWRERVARYRKKHPGRERASKARYRAEHPEKTRWDGLIASSKRLGMPFILVRVEFERWFLAQEKKCTYCDLVDLSLDSYGGFSRGMTIDRRDSNLPYFLDNMTMACWSCNRLKSNIFTDAEWREIAQKYIKPKWQAKLVELNGN